MKISNKIWAWFHTSVIVGMVWVSFVAIPITIADIALTFIVLIIKFPEFVKSWMLYDNERSKGAQK